MNSESRRLRSAILIVSETAYKDPTTDRAGNILRESLSAGGGDRWAEPLLEIVPDDAARIELAVRRWSDDETNHVNLIMTTGGTGFGLTDITPEVVPLASGTSSAQFPRRYTVADTYHRPLHRSSNAQLLAWCESVIVCKKIYAEFCSSGTPCWQPLSRSHHVSPSTADAKPVLADHSAVGAMSRPVAGVRGKSLILTLPGSPKGAKENLEAVLKLLPHACMQAAGADSRAMHAGGIKKLEEDAGVSAVGKNSSQRQMIHHHNHEHDHHGSSGHQIPRAHTKPEDRPLRSNDPALGVSQRNRSSPYPMLSVSAAVSIILEHAPPPENTNLPLSPVLVGSAIASDVLALEPVPAYRASIVDGYAVIVPAEGSRDVKGTKGIFPVASVSNAQASSVPPPLAEGTVTRITTGAPLPPNANAVVMVEDTTIVSTTADGSEEAAIEILTDAIEPGENIREPGSDIKADSLILPKGTTITSLGGEIGVLAAAGIHSVPVFAKPRVGILSTGDEVTDISHHEPVIGGQIRDSNRPSLLSVLQGWNLCSAIVDLGIARDTPAGSLESTLRSGFRDHDLDIIVTTGGVSMGELDLLKPTIERGMGGTVHFGRVSMKPGKPTTFATVPVKETGSGQRQGKLIFGLPGNPASAIVTAHLFVLPALQKMAGRESQGLEKVMVKLGERVKCDKARVEYHRVLVRCGEDGVLLATSTGMQRSSRVGSLASANALLVLPQKEGVLEEGEMCEVLMMGPLLGYT